MSALKRRLLAGYVYIPPQTPALDKGGACGCSANNLPRAGGLIGLIGSMGNASLDGVDGGASLDGRDYQISN